MLPLIGHARVLQRLTEAFDRDRLPHALIFTGPAGIGKARAALELVAYIACTEAPRPCGECAGCMQVAASSHPDLHLLGLPTGKKEIPVDLVRQLKRFAGMQSVAAPRKMAIVDDADRLSIASQNALLKTLEEPPGPALVILVTASPGQLLSTVRSRCQRVLFQPLAPEDVRAVLEQNGMDREEAGALAAQADGSPGLALRGRGVWQDSERAALVGLLADLDPGRYGSVVAMSKALGKSEHEMVVRLEGLLGWYRDQAVRAVAGPATAGLDASAAVRGADIVAEALRTLRRRNPNRPLLAEALSLRLARC